MEHIMEHKTYTQKANRYKQIQMNAFNIDEMKL